MKMSRRSACTALLRVFVFVVLWISNSNGVATKPNSTVSQTHGIRSVISKYSYGNWCGVGNGGCQNVKRGCDTRLKCIDKLDCACKRHDICGSKTTSYNCKCDQDMINELKYIRGLHARAISAAISHSLCQGPVTIHYPCCSIKYLSCSICKSYVIVPTRKWSPKSYLCPKK